MKDWKNMKGYCREFSEITNVVIGCAIEVHRSLGPGLLESTYKQCLAHELSMKRIDFKMECPIPVKYKDIQLDCGYRVDLFIEKELIVELKSVDKLNNIHEAQLLTYLKLAGIRQGLLINFNVMLLKQGLKSYVL